MQMKGKPAVGAVDLRYQWRKPPKRACPIVGKNGIWCGTPFKHRAIKQVGHLLLALAQPEYEAKDDKSRRSY